MWISIAGTRQGRFSFGTDKGTEVAKHQPALRAQPFTAVIASISEEHRGHSVQANLDESPAHKGDVGN
jgi:hypothetical protein